MKRQFSGWVFCREPSLFWLSICSHPPTFFLSSFREYLKLWFFCSILQSYILWTEIIVELGYNRDKTMINFTLYKFEEDVSGRSHAQIWDYKYIKWKSSGLKLNIVFWWWCYDWSFELGHLGKKCSLMVMRSPIF